VWGAGADRLGDVDGHIMDFAASAPSSSAEEVLVSRDVPYTIHQIRTSRSDLIGRKILCLSDTHDFQQYMKGDCENLPRAEILVHAGDFTVRGTATEVMHFRQWMNKLHVKRVVQCVVVVAGNHELSFEPERAKYEAVRIKQEELKRTLTSLPNLYYLEDSSIEIMGIRFYGSPWTTPIAGKMDWAFQRRDADLADVWLKMPGRGEVDVLVTHSPPYGQGDQSEYLDDQGRIIGTGKVSTHTGSRTLLEKVLEVEPILHVFGHFHKGYGVSRREGTSTVFVNACTCDEDYQPNNNPLLLQFIFAGTTADSTDSSYA
jgi:Icc-related predicted phosphoesterase